MPDKIDASPSKLTADASEAGLATSGHAHDLDRTHGRFLGHGAASPLGNLHGLVDELAIRDIVDSRNAALSLVGGLLGENRWLRGKIEEDAKREKLT